MTKLNQIIVSTLLFPFNVHSAQASNFVTEIDGCEAIDMQKATDKNGDATWSGKIVNIGRFAFDAKVSLYCTDGSCIVRAQNKISFEGEQVQASDKSATTHRTKNEPSRTGKISGSSVVFTSSKNAGTVIRKFTDDAALEMAKDLSKTPGRFTNKLGQDEYVFMNYGRIKNINIRIRSSLTCDTNSKICTVVDEPVVFVPYSEHQECGEDF